MRKALSLTIYSIVAIALFNANITNAANMIINGSFENPTNTKNWKYYNSSNVPGWSGSNIEIWKSGLIEGVHSYKGGQHAELNAHGHSAPFSIYQTIETVAGQNYRLSFAYRARVGNSLESVESFWVGADNGSVFDTDQTNDIFNNIMDDHVKGSWATFIGNFIAQSDYTTIYFSSISPNTGKYATYGNFLDDISVSSLPAIAIVPIPASIWLFASALVGFIGFSRRRS